MASLTTLPEASASASQSSLRGLPSLDQGIAKRLTYVFVTVAPAIWPPNLLLSREPPVSLQDEASPQSMRFENTRGALFLSNFWPCARGTKTRYLETYPDTSNYTSLVYCQQLFKPVHGFSETMLSSVRASRKLLQAIYISKEKGTSTFYFFEAQIQLLGLIYTFREPRKVLRFLERNMFLAPLLIEAYPKIENRFPNSQLFLEIDTDPEEGNDQQLLVLIATNSSPKEALRRLKQLDEDWWLDALDRAQGKLCINLEFE